MKEERKKERGKKNEKDLIHVEMKPNEMEILPIFLVQNIFNFLLYRITMCGALHSVHTLYVYRIDSENRPLIISTQQLSFHFRTFRITDSNQMIIKG